jgi:hypothetical protein
VTLGAVEKLNLVARKIDFLFNLDAAIPIARKSAHASSKAPRRKLLEYRLKASVLSLIFKFSQLECMAVDVESNLSPALKPTEIQ